MLRVRLNALVAAFACFIASRCKASGLVSVKLEKRTVPSMSTQNKKGFGFTPCNFTFNPAWIEASEGTGGKTGILVRAARCTEEYGGVEDHIMAAYCQDDGTCSDLLNITFPFEKGAQDPRVVYKEPWYYLWYYANGEGLNTVYARRSKTPFIGESWESIIFSPTMASQRVCFSHRIER